MPGLVVHNLSGFEQAPEEIADETDRAASEPRLMVELARTQKEGARMLGMHTNNIRLTLKIINLLMAIAV